MHTTADVLVILTDAAEMEQGGDIGLRQEEEHFREPWTRVLEPP